VPRHARFVLALLVLCARPAAADPYRRPGLDGPWNTRHLTLPLNSLVMIAGPGQTMLMGQRYQEQKVEGGPQYIHGTDDAENEWWLRGGVGFGLTPDIEAGAVFLPMRLGPSFEWTQVTVFSAYSIRFDDFDVAVRLSFQLPRKDAEGHRVWIVNPGIPFLYRAGPLRFDASVQIPFATRDWSTGLTAPVRATFNVSPHVFFGAESGFYYARFDTPGQGSFPLGALAGYTDLFGSKLIDFTGMFSWDSFFLPGSDGKPVDVRSYRIGAGVSLHSLVR
jgi:hypothetical protein